MKYLITCLCVLIAFSFARGQHPDTTLVDTVEMLAPVLEEGVESPTVEDIEEEVKISESEEEANENIVDNTTIEKSKNNELFYILCKSS
jgi:hypothetical protein